MEAKNLHQRQVLIATCLSYVVVILDTSIVNVALEPISHALDADVSGLQWVINAYTLAFASLLLSGGLMGDRFSAKKIYSLGLMIFAVASALCAVASNLPMLIAARILQGTGAALLVPCSLMLINGAYPHHAQRASAIGIWAGCGGIAMAAGPLVGGVLIALLGWRSIFMVNVPLALIAVCLTSRLPDLPSTAPHRPLDLIGQITAITALAISTAVMIEGPRLGWSSPWVYLGIGMAGAAWWGFVHTERRHAHPMLALRCFRNATFSGATALALISGLVFYGLFFLQSVDLQRNRGWSALDTGLAFLPLTVMVALGSFSCGRLMQALGIRGVLCCGFALYTLGFIGLLALASDAPYWRIALCYPAVGFAAGIITPAATTSLMSVVDRANAGVAAATLNASRQIGCGFGVAIFGALSTGIDPFDKAIVAAVSVAIGLSAVAFLLSAWLMRSPRAPAMQG